jgi:hypothetical protein
MTVTTIDVSSDIRSRLRQLLTKRFNLEELKNLCFDLSVDYEMFRHQTKGELSREMLAFFERNQNLSCLVAEMVKLRPVDELVAMLAELGSCSPRTKVQIVLPGDKLKDRSKLLAELAKVLGVAQDEVMLIATAAGSIRVLVSLPAEQAEKLLAMNPDHLGDAYEISSLTAFESLPAEAQSVWRKTVLPGKPSISLFGISGGALALAIIAGVLVTAAITVIFVTPQVTVTNKCNKDIRSSEIFPVVGKVTLELAAGESRDYPIPPGTYEFHNDGEKIWARVPVIGEIGPYDAAGEIEASYENEPIMAGRPLRKSIGLGDDPEIILCP